MFPSKSKILEKYTSPWDKYEQISDIDDQIRDNLKNFISEHLTNLQNGRIKAKIYNEIKDI